MTRLNCFYFSLVAVTLIGGANIVLGQFGGTEITLMEPSGEFMSIGYPNSPAAATAWRITVEEGYRIQLQFLDFQLSETDSCYLDFVRLYDARVQDDANSRIGSWCWNNFTKLMPNTFTSTNNSFYLIFRGHGGSTRKGFKATYFSFNSSLLTTTKSTSHVASTTVATINPGTHPDSALPTTTDNATHVPGTTVGTINPGPHTAAIIAGAVAVILTLLIVVVCIICVFYNRRSKRKNEQPVDITPYYTNYQMTSGNTLNQSQDSNIIQIRGESGGTVYEVPSIEERSDIASDNYDKNIYSRKIHV